MSQIKIGVAILGGSGFGAGELLRYFLQHDAVEVVSVVSSSHAGDPIAPAHGLGAGRYTHLQFEPSINWAKFSKFKSRVIFIALPHGHTAEAIQGIPLEFLGGTNIIDLSADFRLANQSEHCSTYPEVKFEAELRAKFKYGLPELNRGSLGTAAYIANPGCLATASVLAALPLVKKYGPDLSSGLCFDAKTGTSGAGRAAEAVMAESIRAGNCEAYKVLAHRHEPEIRQALCLGPASGISTMFVPHLLPTTRGIFVTLYAQLKAEVLPGELLDAYKFFYRDAAFIRFCEGTPRLRDVVGTNFCDLTLVERGNQVVVMAALDNLGKGMVGQGIQNMNLMFGLPEVMGLLGGKGT